MSKFGKTLLGRLTGSDKSCCCCGSSIVGIRTIRVDDKDMNVVGLDEEFKKHFEAGKTPENIDARELMQNLLKINVVSENELENFKATILKEYVTYWQGNKH
ncbi:hypothetical protein [Methanosarcina sp.]|uniref:hypothetical protein n=1 Tax=Methanosarcina sp. TaxID=2213 RepID=UPI002988739D|nr:hypothetical protein [Methanosarcina sp.]MDW5550441.1 hypothetical protein [Methanosarcina sp.]MDW5554765.1 hypothetical protein [Methanosarcina sp.]MDW5559936.1 hypothetical protein [Methanosarcina sp.]